ncbi:MAG: tetratricopeptide repeat protein, partial [Candidatus Limnocylindrales bacterium]
SEIPARDPRPGSRAGHLPDIEDRPTMIAARQIAGSLPRRPLAVLGLALVVAATSQLVAPRTPPVFRTDPVSVDDPATAIDALGPTAIDDDVARIRANITFWSERADRSPRDFISATRWAEAEIELARATGDVGAYAVADEALTAALASDPGYAPAMGLRGVVFVALHRFGEAVEHANVVLADRPDDSIALATLGDGSLALGDLTTARGAYDRLAAIEPSAAALVRLSHLAFVQGDGPSAVRTSRQAVDAAIDEGAEGPSLAWYQVQLGEVMTSSGDAAAGRMAYADALGADPSSYLARWGLARVAAADGDIDGAIAHLDAAIARVPLPEFHARRADLYEIRGGPGDAQRLAHDRATVLAIAQLGGVAASVRDRQLSLYLSSHGIEPERALRLAEAEITVRKDAYGYDALAWALLATGRPMEAQVAMETALSTAIKDARMLYHAGAIEIALGDEAGGHRLLEDALALDPTFDPYDVRQIRQILGGAS